MMLPMVHLQSDIKNFMQFSRRKTFAESFTTTKILHMWNFGERIPDVTADMWRVS